MTNLSAVDRYLARHALDVPEAGTAPVARGLRLCIVIPAMTESAGICEVLDSLEKGSERLDEVEVIVVVNNPADAADDILKDNQDTLQLLKERKSAGLRTLVIDRCSPGKSFEAQVAGVGLARRVGMDLGLMRLLAAGHVEDGALACLDADSPVEPGYVDAILKIFARKDAPLGGVCRCEHPIPKDPTLAKAILAYETWMRYFELGLELAGSPFSYPTIGSSLVASAQGYAMADGMPTRQAAEDFYFAQKLIKLARGKGLVKIRDAVVHPAARLSSRVPFGTGRAMRRCVEEGTEQYLFAEPVGAFFDLKRWFGSLRMGFENPIALESEASPDLLNFLQLHRAFDALDKIRKNSRNAETFAFDAHCWFDGLKCVRYAHQCKKDQGGQWIYDALSRMLSAIGRGDELMHLPDVKPSAPSLKAMKQWLEWGRVWSLDTYKSQVTRPDPGTT